MIIEYTTLDGEYLVKRFPELESQIVQECEWLGENLPHCIFGDVLNPLVVRLIKSDDYRQNKLLERIFSMYEDFAEYGDTETVNLLQVTLLEYLWDDYAVYSRLPELMGVNTAEVNNEIGKYICPPDKNK